MKNQKKLRLALAAFGLVSLGAMAAEPVRFASAQEVPAKMVVLPTSDPGLLTVTCAGCVTYSFLTSLQTEYSIGGEPVSLKDFRHHLASLSGNVLLMVQISDDRKHVVRVSAPALRRSGALP